MRSVKTILWMIIFLCAIFFSLQNRDEVTLRFGLYPFTSSYWLEYRVPLFLAMLCALFVGVLVGALSETYSRFRLKQSVRQNKKTIERLEEEIQSLRNPLLGPSPIRDEDKPL